MPLKSLLNFNLPMDPEPKTGEIHIADDALLRFDDYCVRKSRRRLERGAQVDQRNTHNLMGVDRLPLGPPCLLEQRDRACVEVARVEDNPGGIAVALSM